MCLVFSVTYNFKIKLKISCTFDKFTDNFDNKNTLIFMLSGTDYFYYLQQQKNAIVMASLYVLI